MPYDEVYSDVYHGANGLPPSKGCLVPILIVLGGAIAVAAVKFAFDTFLHVYSIEF